MRAKKKGIYIDPGVLELVRSRTATSTRNSPIETASRRCTIVPEFLGYTFKVYNGQRGQYVTVVSEMIGHKLGEFSFSRKFKEHTKVTKDTRKKVKK